MRHRHAITLIALALGAQGAVVSASTIAKRVEVQAPTARGARPADVTSVDAIIRAVYDVISGPAGDRDWDRMRALFAPGARLIPIRVGDDGAAEARVNSLEEYIDASGAYFKENAFYETEIARTTESFGHLTHVFSTYESRHAPGEAPFARGINSIQLVRDGDRWWIVTIFWNNERPGEQIPEKYLP